MTIHVPHKADAGTIVLIVLVGEYTGPRALIKQYMSNKIYTGPRAI